MWPGSKATGWEATLVPVAWEQGYGLGGYPRAMWPGSKATGWEANIYRLRMNGLNLLFLFSRWRMVL